MKTIKTLGFLTITILLLQSCKEKSTLGINTGNSITSLKDSTYITVVEKPGDKKVVVEEFTGANCSNCPEARDILKNISDNNPGRIIALELHQTNLQTAGKVPGKSKYDFTSQVATDIISNYYISAKDIPQAGIDRFFQNNVRVYGREKWANLINERLKLQSTLNLKLSNISYDDTKREGMIKVRVAYTNEMKIKQYITIALIENDVVDVQAYASHYDYNYTFKHIFRNIYTPIGGYPILKDITTIEPGRVYEGYFKYTIDPAWNPANCQLVVFVHNNESDNKEILQAEEINIK